LREAPGAAIVGIIATIIAFVPAPPASARQAEVSLQMRGPGRYALEGGFTVEAPPETAWDVLSDYEGLPGFVPAMQTSKVRERQAGLVLLEQESVGRTFLFRHTVRVLLEVREQPPGSISFKDIARKCFKSYEGEWRLEPAGAGTLVRYRVDVVEGPELPFYVPKGAVKNAARELLDAVAAEMHRRGSRPQNGHQSR
jgi:carbon monoxide dehydrogenase subunit G